MHSNTDFTWIKISHITLGCLGNKVEILEYTLYRANPYFPHSGICISIGVNFHCSIGIQGGWGGMGRGVRGWKNTSQYFYCKIFTAFFMEK